MATVLSHEALLLSATLESCSDRLRFLASISPDASQHKAEVSTSIGDEMTRIIAEQRALEARFEELIALRTQLKASGNKTKYKENQEEIQDVARRLKSSTNVLCHNLKDNPNIAQNLLKMQGDRKELDRLLRRTVEELAQLHFTTLDEQVAEEQANYATLLERVEREKEAANAVRTLHSDLESEKREHLEELATLNESIGALKNKLHELRNTSSFTTKFGEKEVRAKLQCQARMFGKAEMELQERLSDVQLQLQTEESVHAEMSTFLARRKDGFVEDLESWEKKSAADKEQIQQELDDLNRTRSDDFIKLNEYRSRYELEVAEKEKRESEERRQIELEEMQRREAALMDEAAIKIQAVVRGRQSRNPPKKGKKGKGGKGKGKKGKKK